MSAGVQVAVHFWWTRLLQFAVPGINQRSPESPLRLPASISLGAGALFALTFVYFSLRARFTVPYVDDWSLLASLQQPNWLAALFEPHNEHIMAVPRLLIWTDFWIWGWPGYATYAAAMLSHAIVVAVFVWLSRSYPAHESRLLIGWVLVTTCTTYALQGAVFPAAVNFSLVLGFGALAIALVARSSIEPRSTRRPLLALIPALLAMLSVTNGLAVPLVLTGLSLSLRLPKAVTAAFSVLTLLGVAMRYWPAGVPDSALAASPSAVVAFTLAILAGPIAALSPRLAVVVGGTVAVLGVFGLWRFARAPAKRPIDALVAGSFAFVVISAAMTAIGRAQFDRSVAAESRYAELASLAWAGLPYYLLWPGFIGGTLARTVVVLLPAMAVVALPMQLFVGRVWAAKADHLRVAALTLTTHVRDADLMWQLHPLGDVAIDPALALLRQRDVAFLRFPERGNVIHDEGAPSCGVGTVEGFEAPVATDGLRIRARLADTGQALRIVDRESRAQGLAWPAPVVSDPRAGPNDFIWAEVDRLTGRVDPRGYWRGLTARGAGEPYRAQLVDDAGHVICTAPVSCCPPEPASESRGELVVRGSVPGGYVDGVDCNAIGGWAWDPVRPDAPIDVRVAASNGVERVIAADVPREDLRVAGLGNGAHGFSLPAAALQLGPGTWQIRVSVAATGVELYGSPKTATCPQ